jgi:hypothetical protein
MPTTRLSGLPFGSGLLNQANETPGFSLTWSLAPLTNEGSKNA